MTSTELIAAHVLVASSRSFGEWFLLLLAFSFAGTIVRAIGGGRKDKE